MTSDRWFRVKELFHAALDLAPEDRSAFLQTACAGDAAARAEVERLLVAHVQAGTFIDRPSAASITAHPSHSLVGRVIGHYEISHLVGAGGMGVVYAARDVDLERRVALKLVKDDAPEAQVQLRREAQRASHLNHPHVCTVYEVGVFDGMTYFAMEHVDGQTLSALTSTQFLPVESVLGYGHQIADALAHAHDRGLIHRDLKSANVMVTREGRVKVLDFGLACDVPSHRIHQWSESKETLVPNEPVAGTLPYMAPELLRGEAADTRSDIWALGIILYEMATGRRPFTGVTGFELSAAILYRPLAQFPGHIPPSLEAIIRRSLSKNPHERYAHAREVAASIEAVRAELAGRSPQPGAVRRVSLDAQSAAHLPVPRTSFIGRAEQLIRFASEVESTRLVTLTGVGGCGKTRLALRLAEEVQHAFSDGVWWVDLAPIGDASRIDEAVAATLGLLNPQRPPRDAVLEFVAGRRLLLVLDNCEHVIAAAGDFADALLATADGAHLLATSREGLGVAGERILAVPSLSVPPVDAAGDVRAVAESDAVRLFCDRAAAVQPGFSITPANAASIVEICRRLDGIPLAIELAAARARLLSVEQIRARLADRLAQLSGRGRAVARHQTLGAALQWSYDLLSPEEQRTLRLLSVFCGGWTLSAAIAVCGERVNEIDLLDLLWRLVEKSLVEVVHTEGAEARYRLLEMVRQFAFERLVAASEAPAAQARHAEFFLGQFESAIPHLLGPQETETVMSLERELDNLLSALNQASAVEDGQARVMRAAADNWLLWVARGRIALGRAVLATVLEQAPPVATIARARALMASSMLARFAGDGPQALADAEASLAMFDDLGEVDAAGFAFALFQRAAAMTTFTSERARPMQDLERGAELSRRTGNRMMLGINLNMLGAIAVEARDLVAAEARFAEALSTGRGVGSPYLLTLYQQNLAYVCAICDRWAESVELCGEALELVRTSGNRHFAPASVLITARLLGARGHLRDAWRLFGAAIGMWAQTGELVPADETQETEHYLRSLGANPATPDKDYARVQAEGKTLAFDAAVTEAIAALQRVDAGRSTMDDGRS